MTTVFPLIKVALERTLMPRLCGPSITSKTMSKQIKVFSQQKRWSAFTMKQVQEVLQTYIFVTC